MKISELVNTLNSIMEQNGDMDVCIMTDGIAFDEMDFNCPDSDSPLYIEGYMALPF